MPAETAATEPTQEDHMTATLPTCPREDDRIVAWHTISGHPVFRTCYDIEGSLLRSMLDRLDRLAEPQPCRFPDGWERGHEAKYWIQTGLTPYGLTLDSEHAPGVLNWLGVNYYTPDSPHLPKPAAVVLPTVGEVVDIIKDGGFYSDTARIILGLIAARLPVWQPVELGTVIKAGTVTRIEWDDRDAHEEVTRSDYTHCQTDLARFYLDPRTVPAEPAEPVDPRVELVAEELHNHGGCEETWPRCSVSTVESYRNDARDLLARLDAARADS